MGDAAKKLDEQTDIANAHELLKVPEVATFLRTTTAAVYAMIERGQMPGLVRIGRSVRVRRDDLRRAYGLVPSGAPTIPSPKR